VEWLNQWLISDITDVVIEYIGNIDKYPIKEVQFTVDGNRFHFVDVGGQKNTPKKWIHCFQYFSGMIFVANISCYDQQIRDDMCLLSDAYVSSISVELEVFEDLCNSRWFHETPIFLFLNKCDIFKEKIERAPLRDIFPSYTGKTNFEEGIEFIKEEFLRRNRDPRKLIYVYNTCAIDPDSVRSVFHGVKDTIIRNSLQNSGT